MGDRRSQTVPGPPPVRIAAQNRYTGLLNRTIEHGTVRVPDSGITGVFMTDARQRMFKYHVYGREFGREIGWIFDSVEARIPGGIAVSYQR